LARNGLDAGGSAEPVGKPPTKKLQTLEKSKTFRSLSLYSTEVLVSFGEISNITNIRETK
jgi:hypothetical protein